MKPIRKHVNPGMPVWPALVCAALLLAPPAGAQTPEKVYDEVVAALTPLILGKSGEKIAAAEKLEALRAVYSVPALAKAYEDPSPAVRKAVVKALGAIVHKSSVKVLIKASSDEDAKVALIAIQALGEMHTDEAYEGLTKLIGKVKDETLKQAVLDGMRKWNKPFTPLPAPNTLPEGKQVPPIPKPEPPAEVKPEKKPEKKIEIKIEETKPPPKVEIKEVVKPPLEAKVEKIKPVEPAVLAPDDEGARQVLDSAAPDVAACIADHDVQPPVVPAQIALTAGGHLSELHVMREMDFEAWECVHSVLSVLEFPPASKSYLVKYEFTGEVAPEIEEPEVEKEPEVEPAGPAPPPLPIELWDMAQASFVTFETATASMQDGDARVYSFNLRGGYGGRFFGAGLVIPFSGASDYREQGNNERFIFNNLGLWLKLHGRKEIGSVELIYGGAVTVHFPTASEVQWSEWGERDRKWLPAMGALYAGYYRHGLVYPDLQNAFKASIRPDFDLGLRIGRLYFQLEAGLDFIVLGSAYNPDPYWQVNRDLDEVYLLHLGFAAAVQPLAWLQASVELTSVVELSGVSGQTWGYNREEVGDPAGSEVFLTPGLSVLLPVGEAGSGHLSVGLRVPLGEVGSRAGSLQLGPILVVATGFRFH